MGIDHIFHRIGNDVARGQGIEHAVVAHRDAVVDGDRIELGGEAARILDGLPDYLTRLAKMHVAGHKLSERIDYCYDRLAELIVGHSIGTP